MAILRGVCLPEHPLDEKIMQSIAAENNLAETAFVVPRGNDFDLRWFTPKMEIDLCGHATLASAFVLSHFVDTALVGAAYCTAKMMVSVSKLLVRQSCIWKAKYRASLEIGN